MYRLNKANLFYFRHYHLIHVLLILLIALLIFWRVFTLSFLIGWDDHVFVLNEYTEDGLFSKNICAIFTEFFHGQYAPINQLYYSTLFDLFGYNPKWFHAGSLLIHLANAVLVYQLIYQISNGGFNFQNFKASHIAFLTATLFLIAPINLEPVAWVSASKVLLYAFFYLIALLFYLKYINSLKPRYYYLTLLFFALSFGSKEQAITFPATMLLFDYLFNRDFKQGKLWLEKAPFVALVLLFSLASLQSQGNGNIVVVNYYQWYERIPLVTYTIIEYFTKTIIPINISFAYPFPFQIGKPVPLLLWAYTIVLVAVVCCLFQYIRSKKWLAFGVLFFLLHIVMVSNIVNLVRHSAIADRYAYLATLGVFFILSIAIQKCFKTSKNVVLLVTVTYLITLSIYTNMHSTVWANAVTLKAQMRTVIKSRPDYRAWKAKQPEKL